MSTILGTIKQLSSAVGQALAKVGDVRLLGKNGSIAKLAAATVREFVNKSAASAASGDYVKSEAVIKSAASAASLRGGRASGRLDHGFSFAMFGRASGQKPVKNNGKVICLELSFWRLMQ